MAPLAEQLKNSFTVYMYDRRARGESGDTLPYAPEREIEDIEALANEAGGEVFLLGISSGAVLAAKAAAQLKDRVKGLALYEAPLVLDADEQQDSLKLTAEVRGFLDKGDKEGAALCFMRHVNKKLDMPDDMIEGMRQSPFWQTIVDLAPSLDYDNQVMGDGSVPTEASAITARTLVLYGGASPEMMAAAAQTLQAAIPNATLQVLDGQTHQVDAAVLAEATTTFLTA
jgi:pimeloyl-ACP methyl ester carboxylesterase